MTRLYRLLLHCYPSSFRAEYGEDMREVFEQRVQSDPPPLGHFGIAIEAIRDIVPNAAIVHADILGSDVRYAIRGFRRAPLFLGGSLLVLALGVGANGAVFSMLSAVLLEPLPYAAPDRVVMIWNSPVTPPPPPTNSSGATAHPISMRRLETSQQVFATRAAVPVALSDLAAMNSWQGNLDSQFDLPLADRAERLRGAFVTPNFFDLLGVRPEAGRLFGASDEASGAPLLVISDALWRREFGGDRRVIGRSVTMIAGRPRGPRSFTIVGVLPPAFRFTYPQETEAWALLPWSGVSAYNRGIIFRMVGRLAPGASLSSAQARLATIREGLDRPGMLPANRETLRAEPISDWVMGDMRPTLFLLGSVALLLLTITCATVANALFVRAAARSREFAVRAAIGADPRRLLRQVLTEGLLLSAAGALVGVVIAAALAPVLRSIIPTSIPRGDEVAISPLVLALTAAVATLMTLVTALAPAWRGVRLDLVPTLRRVSNAASADRSTVRWRQGVVAAQSAMATALLISASLLLTSLWNLGRVPLGFDGDRVLTVEMRLLDAKYRQPGALPAFQDAIVRRVRAVPGVAEVGLTSAVPFRGTDFAVSMDRPGNPTNHSAAARYVDSSYFGVMRIGLARGRLFGAVDAEPMSQRVVVISEAFARQMFGAESPIGQMIDSEKPKEVVGVVRDVRYAGLDREAQPAIYFPRSQFPIELVCLVVRSTSSSVHVGPDILRAIHDVDPTLPAMNMTTIDRIISESVDGRRFYTTATTAFAVIALLLTLVGLVMIISRSVAERERELAIRGAIGATASRLMRLVAAQGLGPVCAGVAVGVIAALVGARLLNQFLFQTGPHNPIALVGVPLLVAGIAAAASLIPARRVLAVAPMNVLRAE